MTEQLAFPQLEHDSLEHPPVITRNLGVAAERLVEYSQGSEDAPTDEALICGSERLRALVDTIAVSEGPEPGTFVTVPDSLERTVFAHTVHSPDLAEGASPDEWSTALPVRLFVHAPDFVDWKRGRADKKNGKSSARVIRQYARQSADTAPPIQHVMVYVQPDGKVFSTLEGDGAHRLAAAMRRGDEQIRARDVVFAHLEQDYL